MSADYRVRFLGRVDGQALLKRMQPLLLPTSVGPEYDGSIELTTLDGSRTFEHEGLGTTITISVDKQRDFIGQRQQVLTALERVMSTGDEDFMVGYYDRPVVIRVKGVVERFSPPQSTRAA